MHIGIFILAISLALSGCQCGSASCETKSMDEGLDAEVCIPGGSFEMGHDKLPRPEPRKVYTRMPSNDWAPAHSVTLKPFHIDSHEVTWGQYRACVEARKCSTADIDLYPETAAALRNPAFANLPVDRATFADALTYCTWVGKRLPTEAEWERAARGTEGRSYPWGDTPPPAEVSQNPEWYGGERRPAPVGSYPHDATPEGVLDLFGSVAEWVLDYYDPTYYAQSPSNDPMGPPGPVFLLMRHEYGQGNWTRADGERVIRGMRSTSAGGHEWDIASLGAPVWFRAAKDPRTAGAGFRCARDDRPLGAPPSQGFWRYHNLSWETLPEARR
jgi:formylglycine-generating enzyme required for sulfatase activity